MDEFDFDEASDGEEQSSTRLLQKKSAASLSQSSVATWSSRTTATSRSSANSGSTNPLRSALGRTRRQRMQRRKELGLNQSPRVHFSAATASSSSANSSPATSKCSSRSGDSSHSLLEQSQDTTVSALSLNSIRSEPSAVSSLDQSQSSMASRGSSSSGASKSTSNGSRGTATSRGSSSSRISVRSGASKSTSSGSRSTATSRGSLSSRVSGRSESSQSISSGSRSTATSRGSRSNESSASSRTSDARKIRSKEPRRQNGSHHLSSFLRDLEESRDDSSSAVSKNLYKSTTTDTPKEPPQIQQRRRLLGTGSGVCTGNNRELLLDDCLFLCQELVKPSKGEAAALRTSSELALLLSSRQNRQRLFVGEDDNDVSALQALLGVFASLANIERTSEDQPASTVASVSSRTTAVASIEGGTRNATHCPQTLQALTMALYFISLDCTLSEEGAPAGDAATARRIRDKVVQHPQCLAGILTLVKKDPVLASLRAEPTLLRSPVAQLLLLQQQRQNTTGVSEPQQKQQDCCGSVASSLAGSSIPSPISSPTRKRQSSQEIDDLSFPDSEMSQSFSVASTDPTKNGRRRRRQRKLSATREDDVNDEALSFIASSQSSSQSVESGDPTKAGRIRRKRRRLMTVEKELAAIPEQNAKGSEDDVASVASFDSGTTQARRNLDTASTRIMASMPSQTSLTQQHTCGKSVFSDDSSRVMESIHTIPVIAVTRILSGKMEWTEKSCLDDVALQGTNSPNGKEDDEETNPLLLTNRCLGENGSIPLLSQVLAETHAAVIHQLSESSGSSSCRACAHFLHDRVNALTALVDEACLLNHSNRQEMCLDGYTPEAGGYLVLGLVTVLKSLMEQNKLFLEGGSEGAWGEIGLESLRALTSLTHENPTAAKELEAVGGDGGSGLSILTRVLHGAVTGRKQHKGEDTKLRYDSIVFCLNSLTNCVESSHETADILAKTMLEPSSSSPDNDDDKSSRFLTWLTAWLVEETGSFRDVVQDKTFGSRESKHFERQLEKHEDDSLVTAGNGFVLLVCLMLQRKSNVHGEDGKTSPPSKTLSSPKDLILAQLPGNCIESKLRFVRNTLTAFCNFYHYSIGDLSVAVVKPIQKLIAAMDEQLLRI